jgi:hypothetical protein
MLARIIGGHDALLNCAGHVEQGEAFVHLVDRLVSAVEMLSPAEQPVSWFLPGAALLLGPPTRMTGSTADPRLDTIRHPMPVSAIKPRPRTHALLEVK